MDRKHQENEKEPVKPVLSVEFGKFIYVSMPATDHKAVENGNTADINMTDKNSSTILEELLALDRKV